MKPHLIATVTIALTSLTSTLLAQAPPAPATAGSDYHGVIELGAKGIKALVVQGGGGELPRMVRKYDPKNKNPYDGEDTAAKVAAEVDGIIKAMEDDFHVPKDQVYIVQSSGIPDKVKSVLRDHLPNQKRPMDSMDAAREAKLVFLGIVPPKRMDLNVVVVLDIGSGNSKGSYLIKNTPPYEFETFSVPFGTGTFAKEVNGVRKNGEDFKTVALALAGEKVLPNLRSQVRNKPGMQNCSRLYLAGGLPYVMTTLLHPERIGTKDKEDPTGKRESDWVEITAADIRTFHAKATSNPALLLQPDLSKVAAKDRQKAEDEIKKVVGIFNQDELTAGAILLKTFMDEMHFDRKSHIFFSRAALYAWPQGYVKEVLAGKP